MLPGVVVVMAAALVAFGMVLVPLGFVPAAAIFLVLSIRFLSGRGWGFALAVGAGSLVAIWLVFRIVFTVLLPAGILPEAELVQALRDLFAGGTR
ncbi:tripartite tricarboxylate transporter TctB family protein [Mangrovicoccus ximenensis]|uniref:tripartite tricarboxylate transporter TctB family protein n=1 Tax=Mangrovicoccus ximenensis TaxID=1911570 RepID=UPI001F24D49F|nr:tripartite tricarboxylate transporter TctB family protein [Mangrovicoccus ximenensis]